VCCCDVGNTGGGWCVVGFVEFVDLVVFGVLWIFVFLVLFGNLPVFGLV